MQLYPLRFHNIAHNPKIVKNCTSPQLSFDLIANYHLAKIICYLSIEKKANSYLTKITCYLSIKKTKKENPC